MMMPLVAALTQCDFRRIGVPRLRTFRGCARAGIAGPRFPPGSPSACSRKGTIAASALYALVLLGCLTPGSVFAQLTTDQVPRGRTIPAEEQIRGDVEKSRFRLGPFRVSPVFRISNAGYDNNVFGSADPCPPLTVCTPKTDDWTATVSAGGQFILPIGSKIFARADAIPSYTWYQKLEERRSLGGFYRASLLAFFNRVSVEVNGFSSEVITFLTSESETQADQTLRDGSVKLELDVTRRLSLFGDAEYQTLRVSQEDIPPETTIDAALYDHDAGRVRGGIRYKISPSWDVAAGLELTRTVFPKARDVRDNESVGYLFGIYYNRPRFYANLQGGYREGTAYGDSDFPEYRTPTGSYFASYFLTRKLEAQVFGRRNLVYALLTAENPYYYDTANGGGLNLEVHRRLLLRGHAYYGTNDYPFKETLGEEMVERKDKYYSLGGGFSALLSNKLVLNALVYRTVYESEFPGVGRSVFRFTTGLSFEGEFSR